MRGKKRVDFHHKDVQYRVGDCILVRGAGEKLPFVGKIKDIREPKDGQVKLQVAWFYRPEEAVGGRKAFHGEKELFKSDHLDWCFASTIEGKCLVHTLPTYQGLHSVTNADFFARFTYKPATHEFRPDRVPVYCVCELPYNPDVFMILCGECEDWYHPQCVGLSKSVCEQQKRFVCPACNKDAVDHKRPRTELAADVSHTRR